MSDLIDRQAAISLPVMPTKYRKYQTYNLDDAYEQGWEDLQECIERLPSAQSQWIPCSERLPRTEDFMIITMLDDSGDIPIIYSDFGWYASVGGFWVVDNETRKNVIAWMPLPEPYGGENE